MMMPHATAMKSAPVMGVINPVNSPSSGRNITT